MTKRLLCLLLTSAIACASVLGQSSSTKLTLIKVGRLLHVKTGRLLNDQSILIEGDRIKEVGPAAQLAVKAAGANVIDLSSATVLPGLIDCHTHLTSDPSHSGYESLGISIP